MNPFNLTLLSTSKFLYLEQFDLPFWLNDFADVTMATAFEPLSIAEAETLVRYFSQWQATPEPSPHVAGGGDSGGGGATREPPDVLDIPLDILNIGEYHFRVMEARLATGSCSSSNSSDAGRDLTTLEALAQRIDLSLRRIGGSAAFVRLGSQSPKDAALRVAGPGGVVADRFCSAVLEACRPHATRESAQTTVVPPVSLLAGTGLNGLACAFFRVSLQVLQVRSGRSAVGLFLASERTHRALRHSLEHSVSSNSSQHWSVQIALRRWDCTLDLCREFRCFLVHGRVTAISQYNVHCFYPGLSSNVDSLRAAIVAFFAAPRGELPTVGTRVAAKYEACVVDVAVLFAFADDEDGGAVACPTPTDGVVLVEINPFGPASDPCLFNWNRDRQLLQGGMDLFQDAFGGQAQVGIEEVGAGPAVRVVQIPAVHDSTIAAWPHGETLLEGFEERGDDDDDGDDEDDGDD